MECTEVKPAVIITGFRPVADNWYLFEAHHQDGRGYRRNAVI
jgi:hypothetical protein